MKELLRWWLLNIGNSIPNSAKFHKYRNPFYKAAGIKIGEGTTITGPLSLPVDQLGYVEIGCSTYINASTRFGPNGSGVKIGNDCLIGPSVSFETGGHDIVYKENVGRGHNSKEIVVENKVWIGANVVVLQGVTIGEASVVAAGAVVVCDIPPRTVWGGVPAKEIKKI